MAFPAYVFHSNPSAEVRLSTSASSLSSQRALSCSQLTKKFSFSAFFLCARTADCEIITKSESPRSDFRIQDELFVQLTCNREAWKAWIAFDRLSTKCLKHLRLEKLSKKSQKQESESMKINFCFIDLTLCSSFVLWALWNCVSRIQINNTINLKQY